MQNWEDFASDPKYSSLLDAVQARMKNISKWYRNTNESDAYFITMGLSTYYSSFGYVDGFLFDISS
jgi:hypothetical protein